MTGILGVILAGGQARRMGGGDKGLRELARGHSLLDEVIQRARPQCDGLVLSANGPALRFASFGLKVLPDADSSFSGPLSGILAGMEEGARRGQSHILSLAADTPFFPRDLAEKLRAVIDADHPIALAATQSATALIRQPTFGLWPVALRHDLAAALQSGLFKVTLWAERHGYALAPCEAEEYDPFFNVNTPEDHEVARRLWQRIARP